MPTYEITATVEPALAAEYERFLRAEHVPDLLATGCFRSAAVERAAPDRLRIRYDAIDQVALDRYLAEHAPRLRARAAERFPQGVTLSRETWEPVERWDEARVAAGSPLASVATVLHRDLAAVRRSVEAYPDDETPWLERPGLPNAGATLVLHLAGNLRHYVGAVLGGTGYVRDRDAEFSRRAVPRTTLLAELDAARQALDAGLARLDDAVLQSPYPERVGGRLLTTGDFLLHLAAHLAYHLGQLDYHRRVVTGDRRPIDAIAVAALPSRDADARAASGAPA